MDHHAVMDVLGCCADSNVCCGVGDNLCLQEQHVRVRELQAEFDKMEDRVRAESAQKADLQVRQCLCNQQQLLCTG